MPDIFLPLLRNTGLLAVVALTYGVMHAYFRIGFRPWFVGLLCGLGALVAMLDPVELRPGIIVDTRTTMVILGGFFGGLRGGLIAAALPAAYRLHLGGIGVQAGVGVLLIGALIGIGAHYLAMRDARGITVGRLLLVALVSPLASAGVLLLPSDIAMRVLRETFVAVNVSRFSGVFLLGLMLLHEQRRIRAEHEVRRLAYTDELSGLSNRRSFYTSLNEAWASWQKTHQSFAIIILDIDLFKSINDAHGHPVGDEVIRQLAAILRGELLGGDVAGRLGGEEFALLVRERSGGDPAIRAEQIRRRVMEARVGDDGAGIRFTVSLGVSCGPSRAGSWQDMMLSADRALYAAKRGGRNRVVRDRGDAEDRARARTDLATFVDVPEPVVPRD